MKVLLVNKFFYPRGGEEVYLYELASILKEKGHEVIPFSTKHPDNWPSPYERYFIDRIELDGTATRMNLREKIKTFPKLIYSLEAKKRLKELIRKTKPDVAHLFNIGYHLSPSVIYVLKEAGIPVVQSVNNYKMVCPNQRLYLEDSGQICFKCKNGKFYHAVLERCIKGSFTASLLGTMENYIYKLLGTYAKYIDCFVVANRFMETLLTRYGIDEKKIFKILNPLRVNTFNPSREGEDYYVYFGRLSVEKGVFTLIKAAREVSKARLVLIGGGNLEALLKDFVVSNHIENVEFLGPKWDESMKDIVGKAKFVVVPSEWYENSPYVIYQAFSLGKPVIGSDVDGGIHELVQDGITGLLFPSGDFEALAEKINYLLGRNGLLKEMSFNARRFAEERFDTENIYTEFISIYERLKEKRGH
jgi:glycosyltransferase involved in cell wall biosynthesis